MDSSRELVLFCGNLSEEVTEDILHELFLQAGPVDSVKIPKDKSGRNKNFAFITFKHECSVLYSVALFRGIRLYDRELQLDHRTGAGQVHNPYLDMVAQHAAFTYSQEAMLHSPNYVPNNVEDGRFSQGNFPSPMGIMGMPQKMNMNHNTPGMRPNFPESREKSWGGMNVNQNIPGQFMPVGPRHNYDWRPSQDRMSMNQNSPEQFKSPEMRHNLHGSGERSRERINMNQNNLEQFTSPGMMPFHRSRDRSRDRMDINHNIPEQFKSSRTRHDFYENREKPQDRMDINQNSPERYTSPGMRSNFRESGEWSRNSDSSQHSNGRRRDSYQQSSHRMSPYMSPH